jgi:hypothetical protein
VFAVIAIVTRVLSFALGRGALCISVAAHSRAIKITCTPADTTRPPYGTHIPPVHAPMDPESTTQARQGSDTRTHQTALVRYLLHTRLCHATEYRSSRVHTSVSGYLAGGERRRRHGEQTQAEATLLQQSGHRRVRAWSTCLESCTANEDCRGIIA